MPLGNSNKPVVWISFPKEKYHIYCMLSGILLTKCQVYQVQWELLYPKMFISCKIFWINQVLDK